MSYLDDPRVCQRCNREREPGAGCPVHGFKTGECDNCGDPVYNSRLTAIDACSNECMEALADRFDRDIAIPEDPDDNEPQQVRPRQGDEESENEQLQLI